MKHFLYMFYTCPQNQKNVPSYVINIETIDIVTHFSLISVQKVISANTDLEMFLVILEVIITAGLYCGVFFVQILLQNKL